MQSGTAGGAVDGGDHFGLMAVMGHVTGAGQGGEMRARQLSRQLLGMDGKGDGGIGRAMDQLCRAVDAASRVTSRGYGAGAR